jgi:hypothetical protein
VIADAGDNKESQSAPNVVPDVKTSLAQKDQNFAHEEEESESKSTSKTNKDVGDKIPSENDDESSGDALTAEEENNKPDDVVDLDQVDSYDMPLIQKVEIAKRLRNIKGKAVATSKQPVKAPKKSVGPSKGWSKVVPPAEKRRSH